MDLVPYFRSVMQSMENIDLIVFNNTYERYRSIFWLILNLSSSELALEHTHWIEL